jgi:hypothetical protein
MYIKTKFIGKIKEQIIEEYINNRLNPKSPAESSFCHSSVDVTGDYIYIYIKKK